MLNGYDLSHWQNDTTFNDCMNKADFIIIKATEGKTYVDKRFIPRAQLLKQSALLYGFYHYARFENNTVDEELENFMSTTVEYITDRCIMVLDWEGNALNYPDKAKEFIEKLSHKLDRPIICYASARVVSTYKDLCSYWWVAHYNSNCKNGCTHDNVNEIMVQYTSTPIDTNVFMGGHSEWFKLCGKSEPTKSKVLYTWKHGNKEYVLTEVEL